MKDELDDGHRRHRRQLSPVYWAGASLKGRIRALSAQRVHRSFPGLLGRGLIEGPMRGRTNPKPPGLSPVYWAGASLKDWSRGAGRALRPLSPVYWAGASLKAEYAPPAELGNDSVPFPGLLGRGLIEGLGTTRQRVCAGVLSPVYWAGASLKGEVLHVSLRALQRLSPVYWAGASLKAGGLSQPSGGPTDFPRSTGPGPH